MEGHPIESLKGIGEKTGKLFRKLGIEQVEDLLQYYPRDYDTFEGPVSIGQLKENETGAVCGALASFPDLVNLSGLQLVSARIKDMTGSLWLSWYNMPYMRSSVKPGILYVFRGKTAVKKGRLVMEQPEVFTPEQYGHLAHSLQPVYSQTKGLGNKAIAKAVTQALECRMAVKEHMPKKLLKKYGLVGYDTALKQIHFPVNKEQLLAARRRLVFDEFFFFLTGVRRLKEARSDQRSSCLVKPAQEVEQLIHALPYRLTGAQERTWREVEQDMAGGLAMNRLIQGDVGSGKTIIAVLALLQAACNGFQGALMAPTEVLARQHYEAIGQLFSEHGIDKTLVLVTGSMTASGKRLAYQQIRDHQADIIIGTHALIQEKVQYDRLALVITDEQHRFGVGQREALGQKSGLGIPHVMVMSATPIPRTLAIILYGDLDISVIDELPASRLPVKNCVVGRSYRKKAYAFIAGQIALGRQAYVICPMVEASEMIEGENVLDYTKLLRRELPAGIQVSCLHGRMKGKEKNQVMEQFARGEIQVLVSTTVVEVGVNVPNATVILIENAERFGLAQLHQLRGRVGRGKHQSYCIMMNGKEGEETGRRLEVLNRSNDGFYIASEDLKLRGPGDIFGIRQSGQLEFKLADIFTDAALLKLVSEEVNQLLDEDPLLEQEDHQELKKHLDCCLKSGSGQPNL